MVCLLTLTFITNVTCKLKPCYATVKINVDEIDNPVIEMGKRRYKNRKD
jgi:hypothetical protein